MSCKKTYYARENIYGSETDIGFANTWKVLRFQSKKERDNYVKEASNLSVEAIKYKDIHLYAVKEKVLTEDGWRSRNVFETPVASIEGVDRCSCGEHAEEHEFSRCDVCGEELCNNCFANAWSDTCIHCSHYR